MLLNVIWVYLDLTASGFRACHSNSQNFTFPFSSTINACARIKWSMVAFIAISRLIASLENNSFLDNVCAQLAPAKVIFINSWRQVKSHHQRIRLENFGLGSALMHRYLTQHHIFIDKWEGTVGLERILRRFKAVVLSRRPLVVLQGAPLLLFIYDIRILLLYFDTFFVITLAYFRVSFFEKQHVRLQGKYRFTQVDKVLLKGVVILWECCEFCSVQFMFGNLKN